MGSAFANLLGDQVKGHSRVLALMNTDVMVRPPTICVSKVTVEHARYTNILMGTVQYATAMGVLDAVGAVDWWRVIGQYKRSKAENQKSRK